MEGKKTEGLDKQTAALLARIIENLPKKIRVNAMQYIIENPKVLRGRIQNLFGLDLPIEEGKELKELDKQSLAFISRVVENLPVISRDAMQYFIEKPGKLSTRLEVFDTKKIGVIGYSSEFLYDFFRTAKSFIHIDPKGIGARHENSDRIVFVNFKSCHPDGSEEACEVMGPNTISHIETLKFEYIMSRSAPAVFKFLVLEQKFLHAFRLRNREDYEYFMEKIEPMKTLTPGGRKIENHFIFKEAV